MNDDQSELIEIHQLRIGMFIDLQLGWMSHPFPSGSFKISTEKQIEIIRGLGLKRIHFVPEKSDLALDPAMAEVYGPELDSDDPLDLSGPLPEGAQAEEQRRRRQRSDLLAMQRRDLIACERRFSDALSQYKQVLEQLNLKPRAAMEQCVALVGTFVGEILCEGESAIRLLSEGGGDMAHLHPVNVTVLSLLLGKSLGLSRPDMLDLGVAAFLHDIGKSQLPDRVRWLEDNFSSAEYKLYQLHVDHGVALGKRMALTAGALEAIALHHELIDGSGFPARLKKDRLSMPAKILALVNQYDNLCNPGRPTAAVTPHEALSLIFAQLKTRFDEVALGAFIRMMGVYPPGSIVQLVDERFAIVVSVNSSRPLKPRILVHEPSMSRHDALILDLEHEPSLGIRRSLKPAGLPWAAMDYLSPRKRICYFFENTLPPVPTGEPS